MKFGNKTFKNVHKKYVFLEIFNWFINLNRSIYNIIFKNTIISILSIDAFGYFVSQTKEKMKKIIINGEEKEKKIK